jgi:hypothetical protein
VPESFSSAAQTPLQQLEELLSSVCWLQYMQLEPTLTTAASAAAFAAAAAVFFALCRARCN